MPLSDYGVIRKDNPTPGDVHVNRPLTNISVAYMQRQDAFVADKVFPNVDVSKQSDRYVIYDRGDFNRDEAEVRAPATETAGGGYRIDNTPSYFCPVYGFHKDIDGQTRGNTDDPLKPDADATEFVTRKLMIRRERIFAANYFTTGIWTTDKVGGTDFTQWDDAASDPIRDIDSAVETVLQSTGFKPNKLVLGFRTWNLLKQHPDIIDRIKYGQTPGGPAITTRQAVAAILELEEILVMEAIYNTAAEGATASHSFIGGNHALLAYATPSPGLLTPTAGYTFSWTGYLGAAAGGIRMKSFFVDVRDADRIEGELAVDLKVIATDLGYFFSNAVSASGTQSV